MKRAPATSTSSIKNLEDVAAKAYKSIFNDKETLEIDGKTRRIRRTSHLGLRFLIVEDYTFFEQNPEKNTVWGKLAKDGHNIMWVIKNGNYVGQIKDGVYNDFQTNQ